MRTYVPANAGFGVREITAFRRLSPKSREILSGDLWNPVSRSTVLRILRSQNPEQALARQISHEVARAVAVYSQIQASGMGDAEFDRIAMTEEGLGSFFSSIGKAIKNTVKKVVDIHKKVLKKVVIDPHKKVFAFQKRVIKQVGKAIKPFIPIILTVVGAVLSPFTGGASMVVATLLNAGYMVAMKAKQARAMKAANAKQAAAIKADVKAQEEDLKKQLDALFVEHQGIFAAAGISQAAWNGLSVEEKLAVVEKINKGEMPSTAENAAAAAEAQGKPPPPPPTMSWRDVIKSSPILQEWRSAAGDADTKTEGIQAPKGTYTVWVEGKKVGTVGTLDKATDLLASKSKAGDRVEIKLNGRSLGLKIVTAGGGVVSIPDAQAAQVQAMPRAQLDTVVQQANQTVSGGGGTPYGPPEEEVGEEGPPAPAEATPAAPAAASSGGSGMTWMLLAIPAALIAAKMKVA